MEQTDEMRNLGDRRTGNFVVVDLTVTNNGDEATTIDTASLAILDDQRRTHETDPEIYVPPRLDMFLDQLNPGVDRQGRAVFSVAPDASGMILQAGDGAMFSDENGYVDLGI